LSNVSPHFFWHPFTKPRKNLPQVQQLHELLEDSGVALVKSVGLGQFPRRFFVPSYFCHSVEFILGIHSKQ